MGKRLSMLFLTLVGLVGLSGGYVSTGLQAYARYQQTTMAQQQHCGGQTPVHICVHYPQAIFSAFYPSYIANQQPLFAVSYSSSTPITLVISVSITGITQAQTETVNATSGTQTLNFIPPMSATTLAKLTGEDNTSLHVEVADTAKHLYYLDDSPVLFHSRWLMQWLPANRLKIAAWVTPDDPAIGEFVTKAAQHLPDSVSMSGYSNTNSKNVVAQVNALYDTLRLDYHMRYLQASVPYNGTDGSSAATEEVKLPSEVLAQHSGMCIEMTTLLASAVERIGMHAAIVIIPGHAFLGVAITPDRSQVEYWDAVQVNDNVAADSANIWTDNVYQQNVSRHTIVDIIWVDDARHANIDAML